jgi:hypothetical protein
MVSKAEAISIDYIKALVKLAVFFRKGDVEAAFLKTATGLSIPLKYFF